MQHLGESCNLGARLKKFVTLVPHLGECCNLGASPKKFVTLVPNLGESCNLGGRSKKFVTLVPDKKICDLALYSLKVFTSVLENTINSQRQ